MEQNKITLTIAGTEANESVRIRDFSAMIALFVEILKEYDKSFHGHQTIDYYRIAGLSYASPPVIVPEAVPVRDSNPDIGLVHESLIRDISRIAHGEGLPERFNYGLLTKLDQFMTGCGGRIKGVSIGVSVEMTVNIDRSIREQIKSLVGMQFREYGEVVGSLDQINLHSKQEKSFHIYPALGPKKIACKIKDDRIKDQAKTLLEQWVCVRGPITYVENFPHPIEIEVHEIEALEGTEVRLLDMFKEEPSDGAELMLHELRKEWDADE